MKLFYKVLFLLAVVSVLLQSCGEGIRFVG